MRRLVAVAALVLAGCGGTPSSTPPTTPDGPTTSGTSAAAAPATPPPPPNGAACYQYDAAAALAPTNDSTPVDCRKAHDAKTFYVGKLSALANGHLLGVESKRVHAQIAAACPTHLRTFLGGSLSALRLSTFTTVWFTPTVADSDVGANWFRCDVISVIGQQLSGLTRSLQGILARPGDAKPYGRCQVSEPGATAALVPCTKPHGWRAVAIVDLGSGKYPGSSSVSAAGQTQCRDVGRSRASDPLNYRWAYEWPTGQQWAAGQTWGYCWVPDAG